MRKAGTTNMKPRLLVIGSENSRLAHLLQSDDWDLHLAQNLKEARHDIEEQELFDVILIESDDLTDCTWRDALRLLQDSRKFSQAIICCRQGSEYLWSEMLEAGAYD